VPLSHSPQSLDLTAEQFLFQWCNFFLILPLSGMDLMLQFRLLLLSPGKATTKGGQLRIHVAEKVGPGSGTLSSDFK
jgi:hypothetical protein